jgi:signal transduction histidine kinase
LLAHGYIQEDRLDGPAAAQAFLHDPALVASGYAATWFPRAALPAAVRDAIARGEPTSVRDDAAKPDGRLDTFIPGVASDGPGALRLSTSLAAERRYVRASLVRVALTGVLMFAASALVAGVIGVWFVGRPIRVLLAKTRRIGAGDFTGAVELPQSDELGALARGLNATADQLAAAQHRVAAETSARIEAVLQLRHADRLLTVGRLASGLAHELGTPLNVVESHGRMIQTGEVEGAEAKDSGRIVVEQSRRMTALVRQLLDFARRGGVERAPVALRPLLAEVCALLVPNARKAGVTLEVVPGDAVTAMGNDGQLLQVVTNLCTNAIDATRAVQAAGGTARAGAITVAVAAEGPWAVIRVRDTGAGMTPEVRDRIFEPFFTTKSVGEGTGLGLAVVHGIVGDHGGRIEVETAPGAGSTFAVYLPRGEPT